ncbi:uncharacterized protein LOC130648544 [Hydractinia symbiolongicarpus]|uniref:uncharacterized protein LOC130648544 n=1 Tax=Hydractinia symbiolongicarpus TaxID=13093 RepID=UPI00254F4592|nr:uncharacterized protein LOC130648544 [Hydractinia symbiolongicarpus]
MRVDGDTKNHSIYVTPQLISCLPVLIEYHEDLVSYLIKFLQIVTFLRKDICRSEEEILSLPPDSTDIFKRNMLDRCMDRPNPEFKRRRYPMLEQMCYAEFLSSYSMKTKPKPEDEDDRYSHGISLSEIYLLCPQKICCLYEKKRRRIVKQKLGYLHREIIGKWWNLERDKILILAPTGVAVINAEGNTIHSALDEISMVSNKLLLHIYQRLTEIFGCADDIPFAGISVIACGDFYQRPSIQIPELTEVMRQRGDQCLIELLNNIREGKLETQNEDLLKSKFIFQNDQTTPKM